MLLAQGCWPKVAGRIVPFDDKVLVHTESTRRYS